MRSFQCPARSQHVLAWSWVQHSSDQASLHVGCGAQVNCTFWMLVCVFIVFCWPPRVCYR